jgi:hypothetical protein
VLYDCSHRSTNGCLRITAYNSERRTGIDSRRLVPKHIRLSRSPSYVFLADGNPDEEKIGAFGVGGSKDFFQTIGFLTAASIGFYSLFSVTEEPWVTSGGTSTSLFLSVTVLLLHPRQMDELLLEGQEGSGQPFLYAVFKRHANKALSAIYTPRNRRWCGRRMDHISDDASGTWSYAPCL